MGGCAQGRRGAGMWVSPCSRSLGKGFPGWGTSCAFSKAVWAGGWDGWCGCGRPSSSPRHSPLAGTPLAVLVVGLGGGSLPLFIHDYFSQARVAVVEIDPSMLEVATRWFGFSQGDRMQVHVSDGLDYVAKLAAEGTVSRSIPRAPSSPVGDMLGTRALGCFHLLLPVPTHLLPCVTSSSLAGSLQLAGLSLLMCAGELRFAASPQQQGLLLWVSFGKRNPRREKRP